MLPVGALLAVVAADVVTDAEIDTLIASFGARFAQASSAAAAASGPEPRYIDAQGRRLRVLEAGPEAAPRVVFLHGYGGDLSGFALVQAALAETFRTIAFDLPGHGGSAKALAG